MPCKKAKCVKFVIRKTFRTLLCVKSQFRLLLCLSTAKNFAMNFSFTEKPSNSETMSKFIQERLSHVEKCFGDLCTTFSSYARKTAKIRDKGDELSQQISTYVGNETLNPSSKEQLILFAQHLSTIQDYRQAQVQRLDANVIQQFASYGLKCKNKKNDLKASFGAQHVEEKKKQDLSKILQKSPSSQFQIAKSELAKASADASVASKTLEKEMDIFEQQKLTDMKKLLMNFVNIELTFHCKALELYTQCYQNLSEINVEKDLEGFRTHIHPPMSAPRLEMARKASVETTPTMKPAFSPSNKSLTLMNYTDDDDDDDDEYDDDDDDDDEDESSNASESFSRLPSNIYSTK